MADMRVSGFYRKDASTISAGNNRYVVASIPVTSGDVAMGNILTVKGSLSIVDSSAGVTGTSAEGGSLASLGFQLSSGNSTAGSHFGFWLLDLVGFRWSYSALTCPFFQIMGDIQTDLTYHYWVVTPNEDVGVGVVTSLGETESFVAPVLINPGMIVLAQEVNQSFDLILEVNDVADDDLEGFITIAYDFELEITVP